MTCPFCLSGLEPGDAVVCRACETPVHAECARLHGGCVTLGCRGTRFKAGTGLAPRRALAPRIARPVSWRVHARRALDEALSPTEDISVALLGLGGLIGLALLL